jgi:hypothetical protein
MYIYKLISTLMYHSAAHGHGDEMRSGAFVAFIRRAHVLADWGWMSSIEEIKKARCGTLLPRSFVHLFGSGSLSTQATGSF